MKKFNLDWIEVFDVYNQAYLRHDAMCWYNMIVLIWDTIQFASICNLRHDASCWYIWYNLFEAQFKFLIYMTKLVWYSMQVLDIYDEACLRHDGSCWYIW